MSIQANETQGKSFPRIDIYISHSKHIETIVKSIRHTALSYGVECRETPSISKCIHDRTWYYGMMRATYYEKKKIVVIGVSRTAGSTAVAYLSRPDSISMALKLIISNQDTVLFRIEDLEREMELNIPEITKDLAIPIVQSLLDVQFLMKGNAAIMNRDSIPVLYYGIEQLSSRWEVVNIDREYVPVITEAGGITNLLIHPEITEKIAQITFVKKSCFEEIIGFDLEKFKSIVPQFSIYKKNELDTHDRYRVPRLMLQNNLLMIAGQLYDEKDFKQHTDLSKELFRRLVYKSNDTIIGDSGRRTLFQFKHNEGKLSAGEFTSPYGLLLEQNNKAFIANEDGSMKLCDIYVAPVTDSGKIRKYNLILKEQKLKITEQ